LALALAGLLPGGARAAWLPTPALTEGPFYPLSLPADSDNDLLQVAGASSRAEGTPLHLFGQVLDREGRALPGSLVEIWQCDAEGSYRHPADAGRASDPGFQGYGRTTTADDGAYHFRTLRPVAYGSRAPHVHVKVEAPDGRRLTTQMFVADDPLNERDFLWRRLGDAASLVTCPLSPAEDLEPGALAAGFLIVL